jgi:hypothetical protein
MASILNINGIEINIILNINGIDVERIGNINGAPMPVDDESVPILDLPGLVAFWDGKVFDGSNPWENQVPNGTAYDLTASNVALHNGQNAWVMNNTASFVVASGTNPDLINNLHKTTGGSDATFFMMLEVPSDWTDGDSTKAVDSIFGTANVTGDAGTAVRIDSAGILKCDQYDDTNARVVIQIDGITNRAFSTDTSWTKEAGWTIAGGVAIGVATSGSIYQDSPRQLIPGQSYTVKFTISNYSAGSITASLGGGSPGTVRNANGTYTEVLTAGSANTTIKFTGSNFSGNIDNTDMRMAAGNILPVFVAWDAANSLVKLSVNGDTWQDVSRSTWLACTSSATYPFRIGSEGNAGDPMGNNSKIYGAGFFDHVLTNDELATAKESITLHYTPPTPITPDIPTSIVAQGGNGVVNLAWLVVSNGGAALSDHVIEYKLSSEPTVWTTFVHAASGIPAIQVTGLVNNSAYDFRISATNAVGTSATSATATATPRAEGTNPFQESGFKLTLPVNSAGLRAGSSLEVLNTAAGGAVETYQSAWFGRTTYGGVGAFIFNCPDGGATTATASSARCEFRDVAGQVAYNANLDSLEKKFCVLNCPVGEKVVIGQIHDINDPRVKLVYTGSTTGAGVLRALYKPTEGASDVVILLKSGITNGDFINYRFIDKGTSIQFYVDTNIAAKVAANTPDFVTSSYSYSGVNGDKYLKFGNYFQPFDRSGDICTVIYIAP